MLYTSEYNSAFSFSFFFPPLERPVWSFWTRGSLLSLQVEMHRANTCNDDSAAAIRLLFPVGAFHEASWAAGGWCTMAAPSGLSCRICLVVRARCSLSFHRSQTATLQVLQGAVPPAPSHRGGTYACVHIGSLEAQGRMPHPDVSQPFPGSPWANLWEPLLQIVCCAWRISCFRNILLNLTKLQLYQEVWFAP